MRCLLPADCNAWVRDHGLEPDPYAHHPGSSVCYMRLSGVDHPDLPHAVLRALLSPAQFPVALQITDWSSTNDQLSDPLKELASFGAKTDTFERRGLVFDKNEAPDLENSFCAVVEGAMSAYVHAPKVYASLLAWEGEFIEGWFQNSVTLEKVVQAAIDKGAQLVIRDDA